MNEGNPVYFVRVYMMLAKSMRQMLRNITLNM